MARRGPERARRGALCALAVCLAACGGGGGPAIDAVSQTVHFSSVPGELAVSGSASVSASASSQLPVVYASLTPGQCAVDGVTGLVSALVTGTCVIAADQSGDRHFAPARQVTTSIRIVARRAQSITFTTPPALHLYGSARVSANADSGLPVGYTSLTPAICNVDALAGSVTDLAAGVCTIQADQPGNAAFDPAAPATQSLAVGTPVAPAQSPGAPQGVMATLGRTPATVVVSFTGPAAAGGSPVLDYTVSTIPTGPTVTGPTSPLTLNCPAPSCAGFRVAVQARNASGSSILSAPADVLTPFQVQATFLEPMTQPKDTVFNGTFQLDSSTGAIQGLAGTLSESMTGPPMTLIPLTYQLAATPDGRGGVLVSAFALNSTDTFQGGGFAANPASLYFGYPGTPNPATGGRGNAYVTLRIDPVDPLATVTSSDIQAMVYADCTALGMMGASCMTGTSPSQYGFSGTMGGYPSALLITRP